MKRAINAGARVTHLSIIALPLASLFVFAFVAKKIGDVARTFEKASSVMAYNIMSDFEGK